MKRLTTSILAFLAIIQTSIAQYQGWKHAGSFYILTTPEGAGLPAAASEEGFPLLLRLDKNTFDFKQAQAAGGDLRFAAGGKPLAYQIDAWDAAAATANIWVRIPTIKGNAHQKIDMFWGKRTRGANPAVRRFSMSSTATSASGSWMIRPRTRRERSKVRTRGPRRLTG